jgi:DNA-binding SARP family transcriptional activator
LNRSRPAVPIASPVLAQRPRLWDILLEVQPREMEPRTRILSRPALAARARESIDEGSLLVIAGAGFGKTTLLREAVGEGRLAAAWLSCTPAERDPGALLLRGVGALRAAAPGVAAAFSERLAMAPDPQIDPQAAMRELLRELDTLLVDPIVLVIDDAEHLDGAPEALALISAMIRPDLGKLRPAVASRRRLDLRVARARAVGTVAELRPEDLVFSFEECAAALRAIRSAEPAHEEVEATMSATEGWPLGISLIARTGATANAGGGGREPAGLRSAEGVGEFLDEEILAPLDPELRAAVVDSGIARALTPRVIEALGLGGHFVSRIERAGLLIHPADGEGVAYHPLLLDLLQERLHAERNAEERQALHARVAPAVAESGEIGEAVEHWLAAEAWREAADVLAKEGQALVVSSPGLLRRWLERLPQEVAEEPAMLVLSAQLARTRGDHPAAARLLRRAIEAYETSNDPGEWMARFGLVETLFLSGEFERTVEVAEGFDAPEAAAAGPIAPSVALAAALSLAAIGRFNESDRLAQRAMQPPAAASLAPLENLRRWHTGYPRGHLDEASKLMNAALVETERSDPMGLRLYVIANLALLDDERGARERAVARWSEVAEVGGALAPYMALHARCWRTTLLAERGELGAAEAELALADVPEVGWRGFPFHVARAAVAALRGDPDEAIEAAEKALDLVGPGTVLFRYLAMRQLATALAAVGRWDRSAELIDEGLELVGDLLPGENGRFVRARLLALRAWLRHRRGDEGSLEDLLRCWEEAGPALRFILRRDWEQLAPVVWEALEQDALDPEPTVRRIADAVPAGSALVSLTSHPVAAVRAAALGPAIASGEPEVLRRLPDLARDPDEAVAQAARGVAARATELAPPLEIRMLGGFSVRRGGWVASEHDWGRAAAAKLVRFLVIHRGEPIPEDAIFEALWPALSPSGARRSLRVATSRARRVLDLPGSDHSAIEVGEGTYGLVLRSDDSVDSEAFEAAAEAALAESGESRLPLLERARSLWSGEPLPQHRYDDWARAWHDRLIDRYAAVLGELASHHAKAGSYHAAIEVARELVELDPLDESAHRALIVAYARAGRRGQALRQYLACHRALIDGLGVEPAEDTSALHARILAGERV